MRIVVVVLAFVGIAALAIQAQPTTQASSQQQEKTVKFEVASVKPTTLNLRNGAMVFGMLDPTGGPGADGFATLPSQLAGRTGVWFFKGLRGNRVVFQQQTMHILAGTLSTIPGTPLVDATAQPAKYDFTLTYTPDDFQMGQQTERFPRIFDAVQSFGLKLEPTKLPAEVIVIDHLEKTPTGN